MPYVFVEELGEGQEEAVVITAEEHNAIVESLTKERKEAIDQTVAVIDRAQALEKELEAQKKKYADAFMGKPMIASIEDLAPEGNPVTTMSATFDSLFGGETNAD